MASSILRSLPCTCEGAPGAVKKRSSDGRYVSSVNNGALLKTASRSASFPNDRDRTGSGLGKDAGDEGGRPGRTVYVSGIPVGVTIAQVLDLVTFGPLESIRAHPSSAFKHPPFTSSSASLQPPSHANGAPTAGASSSSSSSPSEERLRWDEDPPNSKPEYKRPGPGAGSLFLTFLDIPTALAFVNSASPAGQPYLLGRPLNIRWAQGQPYLRSNWVQRAITEDNASRTIYLRNLPPALAASQSALRDALDGRFGYVEHVEIIKVQTGVPMGLVSFLNIAEGMKAVTAIQNLTAWAGVQVGYSKDRCWTKIVRLFHPVASVKSADPRSSPEPMAWDAPPRGGKRTLYLSDIPLGPTLEDLCDVIRGGMLQAVSLHDTHGRRTAVITFIRHLAAKAFYGRSITLGITLGGRPLKITWVQDSSPLSPTLAVAVSTGASRTIVIQGQDAQDFDAFTEQKLKEDFGVFGELERVEVLKEERCAVMHFTNIWNAIKAHKDIRLREEYLTLKIGYGDDQCAAPPPLLPAAEDEHRSHESRVDSGE
ncbi:hypothetical protein B0H16DRAFT_1419788 [Mycena metata]|uniref:RRM domain-containing protein n=1 Tax=Mycena metata TaxID=1033252 RepID=A0AAD7IXF0_9AGAR|nr:hypothetical protein B0H16DRAFT_1419788 [Mycena metata]